MDIVELQNIYNEYKKQINELASRLNLDELSKKIDSLEKQTQDENFWSDKNKSSSIINNLNDLKYKKDTITNLQVKIDNSLELLDMIKIDFDEEIYNELVNDVNLLREEIINIKVRIFLNNKYDKEDAILEIHPGAGGTESQDWANMLYRMYTRYFDKKGYKYEVISEEKAEDAGIKSVSIIVRGLYAYGYLKSEKGVHRLVRISPFDSNKRRHTSFASVSISPLFENNDINIEIDEKDIRVDVYRSSGCGGQGVNTTDSAVRITHLPTKIVVTCQNERSQIQNKERCMEVLKSKLYELEIQKQEEEMKNIKGINNEIEFGQQIRSYVMCPYTLVKDHRIDVETSEVEKVLDGDLDLFINSYLIKGV